MADQELSILVSLKDEASAALENISKGVQATKKAMDSASSSMNDFGRSLQQNARDVNKLANQFGFLGAAITGPLMLAFKAAADDGGKAGLAMKNLTDAVHKLQASIGVALIPIVQSLANIINNITNWFNSLDKETRNTVIQITALVGISFLLIQVFGSLFSKIEFVVGAFARMGPVGLIILAVAAAIGVVIANWDRWKDNIMPVINYIEMGLKGLAFVIITVFQSLTVLLRTVFDGALMGLEALINLGARIPGAIGEPFRKVQADIQGVRDMFNGMDAEFATVATNIAQSMMELGDKMQSGGMGTAATTVDKLIQKIKDLIQKLKDLGKAAPEGVAPMGKAMQDALKNTAALTSGMANLLGSVANMLQQSQGESKKHAKAIKAIRIGEAIMNTASGVCNALQQPPPWLGMILAILIGAMGAVQIATISAQQFHTGGIVGGGLMGDEVPIIAQTGEGVISRKGMESLGTERFNAINEGRMTTSTTTESFYENVLKPTSVEVNMANVSFSNPSDVDDSMARISELMIKNMRSKQ